MVQWTDELDILLLNSMRTLKPFGAQRHFNMLQISKQFHRHLSPSKGRQSAATVSNDDLWERIGQLFDLKQLEAVEEARTAKSRKVTSDSAPFALEPTSEFEDAMEEKVKDAAEQEGLTAAISSMQKGTKRKSRPARRTASAASSPAPSEENQSQNEDDHVAEEEDKKDDTEKIKIDTTRPVSKAKGARGGRKSMPASTANSASSSPKKTTRKSAIGLPQVDNSSIAPSKSKKSASGSEVPARKSKRK